ncbi:MAG: hypothetical protein WA958_19700 [Tunicatimonas sp.]
MPKVLTYHNLTHGEHWFPADPYGKRQIDAISDPEGGNTEQPPTSIPSPFARIDLVRTAFKNIVKDRKLLGNKVDRKLVAECFDVGEVFFNVEYLQEKTQIITWDRRRDLEALLTSANPQHRRLGEVLQLYLEQDAATYNFDQIDRLHIVQYNYKVIGGTSPATLFFSAPNDLSFVDIPMERNRLFSNDYPPLYARSASYQKYWYGLLRFFQSAGGTVPDFRACFSEVAEYLDANLEILRTEQPVLYEEINQFTLTDFYDHYAELDTGQSGDLVKLLGYPLRKKKIDVGSVATSSDFVIQSSKYQGNTPPLVLQNQLNKPYRYVNDTWDSHVAVPYWVDTPLEERKLPGQVISYPYLTVSDFLEPYLIRLVYPVNEQKFFDGNVGRTKEQKGFILPIKPAFFDYFDVADLRGSVPGGKKFFEMEPRAAGGVRVTLRVPVKQDYITLERIYLSSISEGDGLTPDEENNKGVVIDSQFGVTLYPFIKMRGKADPAHYRVQLIDRDVSPYNKHHRYQLRFFQNQDNQEVKIEAQQQRSNKQLDDRATSQYYVLEDEFDYIQVQNQVAQGIIIPKFPEYHRGNDAFSFAIDFGTTNTHVEYQVNDRDPRPFDITDDDVQIATLHDPEFADASADFGGSGATLIRDLIPQEFLPRYLGPGYEHYFPQRTVLGESKNLDLEQTTYALADFNIPFAYGKRPINGNVRISSDLKWSNYTKNTDDRRRVEAFFENLLLLIRNKVLLNRGNLAKTRIIWFYPSSMLPNRRSSLESTWTKLVHRYITPERDPIKLSESIAPFYFYKNKMGRSAADKPAVGIDIGGGTTDIVVFQNNQPVLLTSFRFAANALFGDGFNGSVITNGFVRRYADLIDKTLTIVDPNTADYLRENSREMISFLFELENNDRYAKLLPISFSSLLKEDEDLKILFVVFYGAIIYHLAQLMKAANLAMPRNILFSGRGSKVINITDSNLRLDSLTVLTQKIFEKVFQQSASQIELVQYERPKEITCKGGLLSENPVDIDDIKKVLLGAGQQFVIPEKAIKYPDIDDRTLTRVVNEVDQFLKLLFEVHDEYNFSHHFGVNPTYLNRYRAWLTTDLMEYLKSGHQMKLDELAGNQNVNVEETLFFYPLVGGLNRLAYKIATELSEVEQ